MDFFISFGLIGLGISAFLAATILPLSSELVLSALLLNGQNPTHLIIIASIGNVAGSVLNYGLGRWGSRLILERWLKLTPQQTNAATKQFNRYGKWSLLFAWVPIIGDPLTVIAGILKVNFGLFLTLVTLGKVCRYWIVAQAILTTQT